MGKRKEQEPGLPPLPEHTILRQFEDRQRQLIIEEVKFSPQDQESLFLEKECWLKDYRYYRTRRYREGMVLVSTSACFPQEESPYMITYEYQPSFKFPFRVDFREVFSLITMMDILGEVSYDEKGQFAEVLTMPLSSPYSQTYIQLIKEKIAGEVIGEAERPAELLSLFGDTYVRIAPRQEGFHFTGIAPSKKGEEKVDLGTKRPGEEVEWDELKYLIFPSEVVEDRLVVETRSFTGEAKRRLLFPKVIPPEKVKELLTGEVNWRELPNLVPVKIENLTG